MSGHDSLGGFGRFKAHLQALGARKGKELYDVRPGLTAALHNFLHDLQGSTQVAPRDDDPENEGVQVILYDFIEIEESWETLQDISVYLDRYSYSDTRVTEVRHLRYHVANHLSEAYIMQERLLGLLKKVERTLKGGPMERQAKEVSTDLRTLISTVLKNAMTLRGEHTHQERISDPDLERLSIWEVVATADPAKHGPEFRAHLEKVRAHWKRQIAMGVGTIRALLDVYFDKLDSVVFAADGRFLLVGAPRTSPHKSHQRRH